MSIFLFIFSGLVYAKEAPLFEYIVKAKSKQALSQLQRYSVKPVEIVSKAGHLYLIKSNTALDLKRMNRQRSIEYIHENEVIPLMDNPSISENRQTILDLVDRGYISPNSSLFFWSYPIDNPEIKAPTSQKTGMDPLKEKSWGLKSIEAKAGWKQTMQVSQQENVVVAVIDTGVDYNHEDLITNIWRNKKEIAGDGIDNDENGYIDDIVGWDFSDNDSLPYDPVSSLFELVLFGGNPGHGTHCAGVVGSTHNNSIGTAGAANRVKIMPIRFISKWGKGTTAAAIKSIDYAVENGAHIISASWGGESTRDEASNIGLAEAIERAEEAGVLFVAAAGNGRLNWKEGKVGGFNMDIDKKPVFPASFEHENIITVAAIAPNHHLAPFSNFGKESVDIAAPGVQIMSTIPSSKYQDTVLDLFWGLIRATWDGTSMATPFVAGSLANLKVLYPEATWQELKEMLLNNVVETDHLSDKVSSGGHLNLNFLNQVQK